MFWQVFIDFLTLLSLIGVIIMITSLHYKPVLLTPFGPLPSDQNKYYILGITAAATLYTMVVSGRIRNGLLRSLEFRFRNIQYDCNLDAICRVPGGKIHKTPLESLERDWRAALGLSDLRSMWHAKYLIYLGLFTCCGLLTAAIVSALTPTLYNHAVEYEPMIPDANYPVYTGTNGAPHPCVGMLPADVEAPNFAVSKGTSSNGGDAFGWMLKNGSTYFVSVDKNTCPPSLVQTLAMGINSDNPDDYAYVDAGVAVEKTALGASALLYKGSQLRNLSSKYGLSLLNTTQCVPIMKSNPVQCQTGGQVIVTAENSASIVSADGTLNYSAYYPSRNLSRDSVMANWWNISEGNRTVADIGNGIIVFGAITDPEGKTTFAADLAAVMNDPDRSAGLAANSTYSVTCYVRPSGAFEYRQVTLDFQGVGKVGNSNYAYYLSGGEACIPANPTISTIMFATVALANYNLVLQNLFVDGYFSIIHRVAGDHRGPPYAFPNSRNALEDVLGLVAALGVSALPINNGSVVANSVRARDQELNAVVLVTRLGTETNIGLVLLLPPVASFAILLTLFCLSFRPRWRPGAGMGRNATATDYVSLSISELTALGPIVDIDDREVPLIVQGDRVHDAFIS